MLRIQIINREMRKRIITKAKKLHPTVAPKQRKSTPQKAGTLKNNVGNDHRRGNGAFSK